MNEIITVEQPQMLEASTEAKLTYKSQPQSVANIIQQQIILQQ